MPARILAAALALLLASAGSAGGAFASSADPAEAFHMTAMRTADGGISLSWDISDGTYLYRDHMSAKSEDGDQVPLETPPGTVKDDPNFGRTETYTGHVEALVAARYAIGALSVTYQGCEEGGICFPPTTVSLNTETMEVSSPDDSAPPAADSGFVLSGDHGLVEGLIGSYGMPLAVLAFFVFGILIAFTPCVLPMYPIVAGILAHEGESLTARRGLALSLVYSFFLSSAFGAVGAVAGWSGENLQEALHSPAVNVIAAAAFGLLSLSMFGLYELQLPAGWTSRFSKRAGARGSYASAAALGFSSALIVGPCVTAPLAASLLYVVKTGNAAFGAASLFALGFGKCAPLIVFATIGGRALPHSGQWMENVKQLFGFAMLGGVAWMAAPLLPQGAAEGLAGAVAMGAGIYVAAHMAVTRAAAKKAAVAVGTAAFVYGTAVHAASAAGAWRPLEPWTALERRPEAPEVAYSYVTNVEGAKSVISASDRPTMVYFTANWCVECMVAERSVWMDPSLGEALKGIRVVKVDLSDYGPSGSALMKAMAVAGPPTSVFFEPNLHEILNTRIVGAPTIAALAASASTARNAEH